MRPVIALALLTVVSSLRCQDLLWRAEGVTGLIERGRALERLGDYNADGWEDLLELGGVWTGTYRWQAIRFVSGQDGSILSSWSPPWPWGFSNVAPLGDMNQDGLPDYGGHYYDGQNPAATQTLTVFSGANHAILWSATIPGAWSAGFGKVLAGELDVNGDGRNDVVTTAWGLSTHGAVIVFDNSGAELYRVVDPVPGLLTGLDVASLRGDLDGDGAGDFVVSAAEPMNRGCMLVFSGRTGALLRTSYGAQPGDKLVNAGSCGDIDRDGVPDYCGGGSFGNSVVTAFSGATGQIVHSWRDTVACCMGINVMGGHDLDQDGVPDLAAGSLNHFMNVFSGRDGTFLARWPSISPCSGVAVTMLAPPPGEQYPLLVFSEACWFDNVTNPCHWNGICPGVVFAYRGSPRGVRRYGLADRSSIAEPLARAGMRSPTAAATPTVRFTISEAPPNAAAVLLLGSSSTSAGGAALPIAFDPLGLPGIALWTSVDASLLALTGTAGADRGYAAFDVALPPGLAVQPTGLPLFAQWIWVDLANPSQHGSTAGQRFRLQ